MNDEFVPKVVNCLHDEYDVFIGRPSKWGNPFKIGEHRSRYEVIFKFKTWFLNETNLWNDLDELIGMRLGCYCKPLFCHGDILRELVRAKIISEKYNTFWE
jgi:hypothetical protein